MGLGHYLTHDFIGGIIGGIISTLLYSLTAATVSQGLTGNAATYLTQGSFLLLPILVFVAVVMILAAVRRRFKQISNFGPVVAFVPNAALGWVDVPMRRPMELDGVVWKVQVPRGATFQVFSPDEISVSTPPRCPICGTELSEARSFWGGYMWRCPQGHFKKRNQRSFSQAAEDVVKIAKRSYEMYVSKQGDA